MTTPPNPRCRTLRRPLLPGLLAMLMAFGSGCTSVLWDKDTFAHSYRPASPASLHLFYSKERRDILVQYSEDRSGTTRLRCYWLEANTPKVNAGRKPHFVSVKAANGLTPIPVSKVAPPSAESGELHAIAPGDDGDFTLLSGAEVLNRFRLPIYAASSQTVKQVLLTPFAVAVDLTIIGGVIAYLSAPGFAGVSK